MISLEILYRNMLDDEAHGRLYIKNTGIRFYTTNIVTSITNNNLIIDVEGFIKRDKYDQLYKFLEYIEEPKEKFIQQDNMRSKLDIKCNSEHLSDQPFDNINLKLLYGVNNEI